MTVTLRKRKKGKKISLYLDYYKNGKRKYEYLKLYLHPAPVQGKLTKAQKDENKRTIDLAEKVRAKRLLQSQNGNFGFLDQTKLNASFLKYYVSVSEKRRDNSSNYNNWKSAYIYLKAYSNDDIAFSKINRLWVEGFKEFLLKEAITKGGKKLSRNSAVSYFNKVMAALKQAVRDNILDKNPSNGVDGIKQTETHREFLTLEELQQLAQTDCDIPNLKPAFLFSALTGLRFSDIEKLIWSEVYYSAELGNYIRFHQQKTKGALTHPISEQARNLLGTEGSPKEKVFKHLKYSAWQNLKLKEWAMKAGISKSMTFHTARHTYATLQLTNGTDIYTVSKLLGHKELRTTQIYAQVIDKKKLEAANKIQLNL